MADRKKAMFFVIGFFILLKLFLLTKNVWWDSAVYIGIGKYIFSWGNAGLFEASRPLVWPIFLGFLWKIGLGVIFLKFFEIVFGAGCIYLIYLIGKEVFNEKTALISALFLAFSPTFFSFSSIILTEIPSTFFGLASVYFFIKKRYFLVGLFSGLAFMTRFLQLIVFFILLLFILINYKKEKNILNKIFIALNGFLLVVLPYLIFNYFMYKSILYPFLLQSFMAKYTGWLWHEPMWFYFLNLLKESFVIIFSLIGLFFIFKKIENKKILVTSILILFLTFFTIIKHKEMRFTIVFMPYLYLISSYGLLTISKKIKNKKLASSLIAVIILALFFQYSFQIVSAYNLEKNKKDTFNEFQSYLNKKEVVNSTWISNPVFAVYSDKKIDELMYYPTFNHDKFIELMKNLNNADHILINTCDLYCEPYNKFCKNDKTELINALKNNFNEIFYKKERECDYYIFTSS